MWRIGVMEKIFGELLDIYRDGVVYYSANKRCAGRIIGDSSSFLNRVQAPGSLSAWAAGGGALKKNCAVADATR